MKTNSLYLLIVLLTLFAFNAKAQVRQVDFTKANSAFDKRFTQDKSKLNSQKFDKSDKRYSTFTFAQEDKVFGDAKKESYWNSNPKQSNMKDKEFYEKNKTFASPDFSQYKDSDRWSKASNELHLNNKDKDLTKKYQGRADFTKRNDMQEKIRADYSDHIERSMTDINKYYFRSGRTDDPGIPTSVAGSDINKKEDSIFDLLDFSKREITSSKAKIVLPRALSSRAIGNDTLSNYEGESVESSAPIMRDAPNEAPQKQLRQNNADMPQRQYQPVPILPQPSGPSSRAKEIETDFNFSTLGLPEEMQGGKTTIKVNVKKSR